MALYRVIVRLSNDDQIVCRFRKKVSARVFQEIGEQYLKKYHQNVEGVYICRVDKVAKPRGEKTPGSHWCPYCADWRRFKSVGGLNRCEICLVSDKEFWVKHHNQIRPVWRKGKRGGGRGRWKLYKE